MEEFKMPDFIDGGVRYIICPDTTCNGFLLDHLQCRNTEWDIENFPELNLELCPHLDRAKKVVFCYFGHPIESKVNSSDWERADCRVKDCHSFTSARMSRITHRIPLERYEEFLKLPYRHNTLHNDII